MGAWGALRAFDLDGEALGGGKPVAEFECVCEKLFCCAGEFEFGFGGGVGCDAMQGV